MATKAQTKAAITALGLVARWDRDAREWRITVPPGSMHYDKRIDDEAREAVAMYVADDDEPLSSAKTMRAHFEANPPPGFRAPWARRDAV